MSCDYLLVQDLVLDLFFKQFITVFAKFSE
jgi:hypothetical protein